MKINLELERKIACPCCKGSKKQTVAIEELTSDGIKVEKPSVEIECVVCEGKGEITQEFKNVMEDFWCKCGHKKGTRYFDDYEHPKLDKHHWRCLSCNRVTQVG